MASPTVGARFPNSGAILGSQVRYQLLLLLRSPRAVVFGLLLPCLILLLRASRAEATGSATNIPLIGGLSVFGIVSTAYVSHATAFVAARESGILRRWRATPLPVWTFLAGKIGATTVLSLGSAALTILVGGILYGVHLDVHIVLSLLVVFIVGILAWAAVGTAVTAFIPNTDSASPILMISYLPVVIFSGAVFGSISTEPSWLVNLMRYLPAQPMVDGAIQALRGTSGLAPGRDLLVLAGWAIGGLIVSVYFFRWDPTRPRHARSRARQKTPAGKSRE